ncbi:MAG TPA: MFS transporter [Acidocella sp.]|jgi:MFS family permease|nr:MFS transporter [Acidocella sp.]
MPYQAVPVVAQQQVIPTKGPVHRWIEPWYVAYAILGALASGLAVILIPLVVTGGGGGSTEIGTAIAAQNIGALMSPFWGGVADKSKAYRSIFFGGFLLIGLGFLAFTLLHGASAWLAGAFLVGLGTAASNTVASLFVVEFTPPTEWSVRISWLQTFNASGSVIGMFLAGWLAPHTGTLISALLVLPALLIGGHGLPVPAERLPRFGGLHRDTLARLVKRVEPVTASVITRIHHPRLWDFALLGPAMRSAFGMFLAGWFCFSLAVSAFSSLYPVLMQNSFGMAVSRSSTLIAIVTALSIPLYNLAGRLVSRFGPATMLGVGIGARALALLGLGVVALTHLSSVSTVPVIILFTLFQGIWPLLSVSANDLAAVSAPFGEGAAMGLFNAAAAIASAAGAILGGVVADHLGYGAVSVFAGLVALGALACVVPLARQHFSAPQNI